MSDDPQDVWLSPERVKAARGLLNWSLPDLARKSKVSLQALRMFEDYGEVLDVFSVAAIKAILLQKVCLTIDEGRPGVVLKREAMEALGPGELVFGGPLKRRPKL